jgi:prolyl-tRNA synthetase
MRDEATVAAGEDLYTQLRQRGIDVVLDDRDARAGVKFADTELTGIPWRITVGPKGVAAGMAELTSRVAGETIEVPLAQVVDQVTETIEMARVPDGADPIFR